MRTKRAFKIKSIFYHFEKIFNESSNANYFER